MGRNLVDVDAVLKLYASSKYSAGQIARILNINPGSVVWILKKRGLRLRAVAPEWKPSEERRLKAKILKIAAQMKRTPLAVVKRANTILVKGR